MAYLLGIDVSTTATKALLIDEQGAVVAVAAQEYGYETPQRTRPCPLVAWGGAKHTRRVGEEWPLRCTGGRRWAHRSDARVGAP